MKADRLTLWVLVILLALQPLVGLLVVAEGLGGLEAPGASRFGATWPTSPTEMGGCVSCILSRRRSSSCPC